MPYTIGQRPLMDFLSYSPVEHVTRYRGILERRYIYLYDYFNAMAFLYEVGAILGRAKRSKLDILEQLFEIPIVIPEHIGHKSTKYLIDWQKSAEERLHEFEKEAGNKPDTFEEFIFARELQRISGIHPLDALESDDPQNKKAFKAFEKKIPLKEHFEEMLFCMGESFRGGDTETKIRTFIIEGIGFGSFYPELTERMNRNFYESLNIDTDLWPKLREVGYTLPQEPTILTLNEQEEIILEVTTRYTAAYYPELLKPLALKRYYVRDSRKSSACRSDLRYKDWFTLYFDHLMFLYLINKKMKRSGIL